LAARVDSSTSGSSLDFSSTLVGIMTVLYQLLFGLLVLLLSCAGIADGAYDPYAKPKGSKCGKFSIKRNLGSRINPFAHSTYDYGILGFTEKACKGTPIGTKFVGPKALGMPGIQPIRGMVDYDEKKCHKFPKLLKGKKLRSLVTYAKFSRDGGPLLRHGKWCYIWFYRDTKCKEHARLPYEGWPSTKEEDGQKWMFVYDLDPKTKIGSWEVECSKDISKGGFKLPTWLTPD
jgi:hypothetical protein